MQFCIPNFQTLFLSMAVEKYSKKIGALPKTGHKIIDPK
jgi:hypothetical protein